MSPLITGWLCSWALFVHRHGKPVLSLLCLCSVVAAFAAAQLFALDSDVGKLIKPSAGNRWHEQNEAYKRAFPHAGDAALVVISGRSRQRVDAAADALQQAFASSDWYYSVDAPGREPFFVDHLLYRLEPEQLRALVDRLLPLQALVQRLDQDPQLATLLDLTRYSLGSVTAGGDLDQGQRLLLATLSDALAGSEPVSWLNDDDPETQTYYQLIVLKGRQQFGASTPSQAVMKTTREIIAGLRSNQPGISIRLTGELAMADEELQTALQGIQFAGALSLALLALILGLGVRSWSIVLATFTLLGAGVAWTSLYASLVVGSFNTLSLVFLVMFFGLGVDFALHYCLRIEEAESTPAESGQPLLYATRDIGTALLLCTVTTGIAFLAFLPTEYRGLAELGIISGGGMLIAFILTMTLIPAWFAVWGMPRPWQPGAQRTHFGLDQLSPKTVLAGTALLALEAAWFARDARFDYSVLAMRDRESETISTLLELQRAGIATDYSVSVQAHPDQVDSLRRQFLSLPSVATVATAGDAVPDRQEEKHALLQQLAPLAALHLQLVAQPDRGRALAASGTLAEQLDALAIQPGADKEWLADTAAALRRLTPESVPGLQDRWLAPLYRELRELQPQLAAQPYTLADLPETTRARLIAPDGRHLLRVTSRETLDSLPAIDRFVSEVEQVAPNIAGRTVVERGVGQAVVRSFRLATGIALAGICLVLLLYFREPLTPLLVLIPLGLTTLFTFAVIELTGLSLNMANILVVPLIFGLGVDTGVHVVHRYHAAGDVGEVLRSSTPRAVTLSALTTIGTFFSLSFSPHKGAASIGLILSVAIAILMVVTFVVLPALLTLFEPINRRGARSPGRK